MNLIRLDLRVSVEFIVKIKFFSVRILDFSIMILSVGFFECLIFVDP